MRSIPIRDKKWHNTSIYDDIGRGLKIHSFTIKKDNEYYGFIDKWEYEEYNSVKFSGTSQADLISFLKTLAKTKTVVSENKKEILLIYTDNLLKAKGFLQPIITENNIDPYFQVCDTIEFRDISKWTDECDTIDQIAYHAHHLINDVFIENHYFYLTPNQQPRKYIAKAIGKNNIVPDLMPLGYQEYVNERQAIFGGMLGIKRKGFLYPAKEGILIKYFDLSSAYPYVMVTKKYPMTKLEIVHPDEHETYNQNKDYFTIGLYRIKYSSRYTLISTYKDIHGTNLEHNNDYLSEATIRCCGLDLLNICKLCDEIEIECLELKVSKMYYLPKPIRDEIIKQYKKKESLRDDSIKYNFQKKVINGISGDLTLKPWDNKFNKKIKTNISQLERNRYNKIYKKFKKKCIYSVYWGILVTAYVRDIITTLALMSDALYVDTDGLFMYGYDSNVSLIYKYNEIVRQTLNSFGYTDINLGMFKEEKTSDIDNFIAYTNKTYAYHSIHEKMPTIKFAGMKEEYTSKIGFEVFDKDFKLQYGKVISKKVSDKHIKYDIYESDGFYYEKDINLGDIEGVVEAMFDSVFAIERSLL